MDSTRGQASQITVVEFHPSIQWSEDPQNHVLRVFLPGFRKEDFRVQVDSSGKLTVRGVRSLGEGKFMRMEQVFEVPKDSNTDKISGRFEDGCLSLFMPKKVVQEKEVPQRRVSFEEKKKEEGAIQKKPQPSEDTKAEDTIQKEKPTSGTKKEEEPVQREKLKTEEKKQEAPKEKRKTEEKKEEAPIHEKEAEMPKRKEKCTFPEPTPKQQPRSEADGDHKIEASKKKGVAAWKDILEESIESLRDNPIVDGFVEQINKKKEIIVVAVAAFTLGFLVSRKLRSSGK